MGKEFLSTIDRKADEITALAAIGLMAPKKLLTETRKKHFAKTGGKYVSAMPPDLKLHI